MKKGFLYLLIMIGSLAGMAQTDLPLHFTQGSDTTKPLLVYLSGDGGMNSFTNSLIKSLNEKGYAVLALDCKTYFWKKKDPAQFATAVSEAITKYLHDKKRKNFVVIGYSFGADVTPFLLTRSSVSISNKCSKVVMLSPSSNTSFEIKLLDMLGFGGNKGKNVVNELNKIKIPVVLFFGEDEKEFPLKEVTIKKQVIVMQGGHHYDSNVEELSNKIAASLK